MDPGPTGQKAGPHRPRGARYHQHRLWRRRLENAVLHQPDPSGRGEGEDSWHARTDPGTEKIALVGSWEAGEKIGQITNLLVADRVEYLWHGGVVGAARIVLVFAQRLHEVVLTLTGQPRHILFAGKIRVMAEVAPVLLDKLAGPFESGRITGLPDRARRRQFGNGIGQAAQIVVGEPLRLRIHRLDGAELFSEHVELSHDIKRRLRPER